MPARRTLLCALAAGLALPPGAALAQATAEGAAELQLAMKTWLTEQLAHMGPEVEMVFENGLTVEPGPDGYVVHVGAVRMTMGGAMEMTMPGFDIDVAPRADGWFDVAWDAPTVIRLSERFSGETFDMQFGINRGTGAWSPEYGNFAEADMEMGEFLMMFPGGDGQFTIDMIRVVATSDPVSPGVYDNDSTLTLTGLVVEAPFGEGMSLDELTLEAGFDDVDFAAYSRFMREINTLSARFEQELAMGDPSGLLAGLQDVFADGAPMDGFHVRYGFGGFYFNGNGMEIAVDEAGLGIGFDGFTGGQTDGSVTASYDGLVIPPLPAADFIPTAFDLEIAALDLPNALLTDAVGSFFANVSAMGPEAAGPMALMELQQGMLTSGATLALRNLALEAAVGTLRLSGDITPSASSPFGMVVQAMLEIGGLDRAVTTLERMGMAPPDAIDAVEAIGAMGETATGADGSPILRFSFELTPAGEMLLNGEDLEPVLNELN